MVPLTSYCIHIFIHRPLTFCLPFPSLPAALPIPRPCPASRPPPLAALPCRSPCPTRNPDLHAPSTPAAPLSSARRQLANFLLHPARFYKTRVARAHPWATWPPLSPPFVLHPILAVIAFFFNSVTRHFQFQGLLHYFPFLQPSTISHPTAHRPFQDSPHLVLPQSHPSHAIEPIRGLHIQFSHSISGLFPDPGHLHRSAQFKSFSLARSFHSSLPRPQ